MLDLTNIITVIIIIISNPLQNGSCLKNDLLANYCKKLKISVQRENEREMKKYQ